MHKCKVFVLRSGQAEEKSNLIQNGARIQWQKTNKTINQNI